MPASETKHFPTFDQVTECVPANRKGYILTSYELDRDTLQHDAVYRGIGSLAAAHERGDLEPPLPSELSELIGEMASFDRGEFIINTSRHAAILAIKTALDHGASASIKG